MKQKQETDENWQNTAVRDFFKHLLLLWSQLGFRLWDRCWNILLPPWGREVTQYSIYTCP